jgi:hypothetical protein
MASSGNFSTFNTLDNATSAGYGNATFANGNTETTGASTGHCGIASTIATGNTGKYYAEFYLVATSGNAWLGYYSSQQTVTMITASNKWVPNSGVTWSPGNLASYFQDGSLYKDGSTTSSWGASFTTGDIIQIAIDADNDAVYYGKNNTWQNSGDPTSGASKTGAARTSIPKNIFPAVGHANGGSSTVTWKANFGQDSTFAGTVSAGGNADANGFGDFKYAPPSGYVALSSANLPISADIDPAGDDGADENPQKQFGVVTYTGNATTGQAISGLGLRPDLVWAKMRSSSQANFLSDTSRGINTFLQSDSTNADLTGGGYATVYSSFDSDGFTFSTSGSGPNDNGRTYVAWCWRANGGTTASNSDGSITTTTQANTAGGFSIITYTGTGSNATIGHGLSKAPEFYIVKNRSSAENWTCYHIGAGETHYLTLNTNAVASDNNTFWNDTAPTTSVISLGTNARCNGSSNNMVGYAWHSVEGYSKFGKFEGNSNADGPFVYTGFRPRLVFCKAIDATENWQVRDTARSTFNADSQVRIYWNSSAAEGSASTASPIDFLSNGFKVRGSNSEINTNTIVYGAWGDVPFKYNNTF